MTAGDHIANRARVLGLRLRLGLVDLPAIEQWADQAILEEDGHDELVDLCLATKAGDRITQRLLASLGGAPTSLDLMRAIGAVKVGDQTQDELRRLADNLDPVLKEIEAAGALPELLKLARGFARDFWEARMQSADAMSLVEARMRELLHAVKEYAAELPEEDTPKAEAAIAPKVSAVVVSYRTGEVLLDCIGALVADPAVDEIVLVNNGNPVEMLERVEDAYGGSGKLVIVGGGENRGFAAGVNLGAAKAQGGRLLVLNPDAVLNPGSVEALETALAGAAEPAVVGGRIHDEDGKEQRGARRRRLTMRSAAATFLGLEWLKSLNPGFVNINRNDEPAPDGPVPMDAVSGALMYFSASGFRRLGGFDDGYFLHVEDLDLCRRAEAEGGTVIYTPLASALHHGATSDATSLFVERHKGAGLNRYFRKFAETPGEKAVARMLGPVIGFLLVMRARLRG